MRAVSNTSPLSNLAVIGRLDLLRSQLSEIWIPDSVLEELKEKRCLEHVKKLDLDPLSTV